MGEKAQRAGTAFPTSHHSSGCQQEVPKSPRGLYGGAHLRRVPYKKQNRGSQTVLDDTIPLHRSRTNARNNME